MIKASVVILNWNGEAMLRKYIPGLYESLRPFKDNNTEQETVEKMQDAAVTLHDEAASESCEANLSSETAPSFVGYSSQNEQQMIEKYDDLNNKSFISAGSLPESPPEEVIMNVGLAELLRRKEEERAANIKARMESLRQRTMAVKEANRARKQLESKAYDAQYELVVADNGSTDGSVAWLKENYPDIRLIEFDKNYGFAGGYNKALQEIDAEYFVLLNSDVRVTPGWLDTLIDFLEVHQRAAICMPKILKENDETIDVKKDSFEYAGACGGFIDRFGFPFCRGRVLKHTEVDENQYDTPMEVFWASGAAMCVRSSVWKELGGLDARFFAHMEEIDFCWRAKLMGYEVWAVPAAKVYHVGGGTLPNETPYKLYLNYRNNLLMLYKNLPPQGKDDLIFIRMLLDGVSAVIYLLQGRKKLYRSVLQAHKDFKEMRPDFEASPRAIVYSHIPFHKLYGVLNGSIVLSYFLGRRRFSDHRQFS